MATSMPTLAEEEEEEQMGREKYRARLKAGPMLGEFCYCSCLLLPPGFACSIHATWGPPFSEPCSGKGKGPVGHKRDH